MTAQKVVMLKCDECGRIKYYHTDKIREAYKLAKQDGWACDNRAYGYIDPYYGVDERGDAYKKRTKSKSTRWQRKR